MSNKSKQKKQRKSLISFNWPRLAFGNENEQVQQPHKEEEEPAKDVKPRNMTSRQVAKMDAMLQAVEYGLRYGNATMRAYPMFRRGNDVYLGDSYIERSGTLSIIFSEAARYIQAQAWTVDIWVETSDVWVRALSAFVEETNDGSGNLERQRIISTSSPLFEPYARALEHACMWVTKRNVKTIAIPPHMRP